MSQITLTIEQLNAMDALEIATAPMVRDKFIDIYNTLWGAGTGEAAYERESRFFNRLLSDNADLQKGTHFSLFTAFIDLAFAGFRWNPAHAPSATLSDATKKPPRNSMHRDDR